ncbi:MAG TPA: hypothetical protein VMW57_02080 [Methyloceanibacter sp.]|nr:hypothetical protein [Methyloceanibacter sp.]
MATLLPLRKTLPRAAIVVAALFALVAIDAAGAQQRRGDNNGNSNQASGNQGSRTRGVGGTSWTLSDVWGEPKMPPPANDFGPGFDYQGGGYNLNGVPNQSPYPN